MPPSDPQDTVWMSLALYAGGEPPYPTCCFQFLSAQFSLLNWALTGALTRLASPDAPATVDTPPGPVAAAEGVALADGLPLAEALAAGLADALAAAAPSTRARVAISCVPVFPAPAGASAPDFLVAEADALGLALAVLELLADGDGEDEAPEDGVGVGVGVAVAVFGAIRSTWRNSSWAVWPTRLTTFWVPAPGTATVISLLPCCCTWASVKPAPFTRLAMMFLAWVMSAANSASDTPLGLLACSVTVVPLVRSRPRCTLKSLPHLAGWPMLPPTMARNSTTMSAASTASARPGREALPLGGATAAYPSLLEFPRPGVRRGAAGQSAGCSPVTVWSAAVPGAVPLAAAPFWLLVTGPSALRSVAAGSPALAPARSGSAASAALASAVASSSGSTSITARRRKRICTPGAGSRTTS